MSRANRIGAVSIEPVRVRQAGHLARLHASLFEAAWDAASFTELLAHPGAIAFVARSGGGRGGKALTPAYPPPCGEGGVARRTHAFGATGRLGGLQNIDVVVAPTPNPSPHFGNAPSARRGGESGRGRGRLSGFIVGRLASDEAEILSVGVAAEWQCRGVGSRLVEELCHEANKRGARRLYLEVAAGNAAAHALYDRLGFRECGRRAGYYARAGAAAEDAINLCLTLDPSSPRQRGGRGLEPHL